MKQVKNRFRYSVILLRQLVKTDFKLRYQGSVLGYLWSLLRPSALFVILYVVFVKFLKVGEGIPHYPVYLLSGIVFWNYFVEVTTSGVRSIVDRGELLRRINFPRYVIVLAGSIGALINLLLNFIVIAVFLVIDNVDLTPAMLILPVLVVELFVFSLAVSFFLSAMYVRFRDISYIWDVTVQAAFYATPILYPLDLLPQAAAKLLILNPIAQIIQDMRFLLVTDQTLTIGKLYGSSSMRLVPAGIAIALTVLAAHYFRKRSRYFAEDV